MDKIVDKLVKDVSDIKGKINNIINSIKNLGATQKDNTSKINTISRKLDRIEQQLNKVSRDVDVLKQRLNTRRYR